MTKIFISYRREDSGNPRLVADRIAARFGSENVFIDVKAIEPGKDFREQIWSAIDAAQIMLVLIGQAWQGPPGAAVARTHEPDDVVRLEVARALKAGIKVLPVRLGFAAMPDEADLPDDLKQLVRNGGMTVTHERLDSDVDDLIAALGKMLPDAPHEPRLVKRSRRPVLLVASGVLVAALAGGVIWHQAVSGVTAVEFESGEELRKQGKHREALQAYLAHKEFLQRAPDDPTMRHTPDLVLDRIGGEYQALGDLPHALEAFQQAKELLAPLAANNPNSTRRQLDLVHVYNKIGAVQHDLGNLEDALATYKDAKQVIDREVATEAPPGIELSWELALNHYNISAVREAQGLFPAALSSVQAAQAILDPLVAANPDDADLQYRRWLLYDRLGSVLESHGRLSEAQAAFGTTEQIVAQLPAAKQGRSDWQLAAAVSHNNIGKVLKVQGRFADALNSFQKSKTLVEHLLAGDYNNLDLQREHAVRLTWIGRIELEQGRLEDALASLLRARAVLEPVINSNPNASELQRDMSMTLKIMGQVRLARAQADVALGLFDEAALLVSSGAGQHQLASARLDMVELQRYRVEALLMLNGVQAAQQACEQGRQALRSITISDDNRLFWSPAQARLDVACGEVLEREGNPGPANDLIKQGLTRLQQLTRLSPDNNDIRDHLRRAEQRVKGMVAGGEVD